VRGIGASTPLRNIAAVGVVGAGTMGSGIAMVFANAGLPVTLIEKDAGGLARGLSRIDEVYERARTKGTLPEPELTARRARITGCTDLAKLRDADLIVEAVFEDIAVKSDVFAQLDKIAKPGAILASNTSALDIDAIAAVTSRPQDVIGLHFFSPAHVMRLLEIVRGAKTEPSVLATAVTLARAIGKVGVVVGVCDGFCANRMLYPYLRQADCLMEEGALPQDIDRALTTFGFAMGPCHARHGGTGCCALRAPAPAPDLAGEHALFQACRSSLRAQTLRQQIRRWLVPISVRSAFHTA
jgi:3-hydroxyacyl-CoA dehydrogenase